MAPPQPLAHDVAVIHDSSSMEWQLIFPANSPIVLNLSRALWFTTFVPARDADASSLLSLRSKHHLVSLSHWDALHTFGRILMLDDNPVEVKEWLASSG